MQVDCENCAGCCVDWRALADVDDHERNDADSSGHERRGPQEPLDDTYDLVPLTREDVREFLDAGLGDAMTPRLWEAGDSPSVSVGDHEVAAIDGKPAFFLGLRKPPKPVAPFDADPSWLPSCVFLDPETLQCRIHDDPEYPEECGEYPGHNLSLGVETECERVEAHFGGDRLVDDEPPDEVSGLLFGPQAVGEKVFAYPDSGDLADGFIDRLEAGELTDEDRARFVAVAAASAPGTTAVEPRMREEAYETAVNADSWVGRAVAEWKSRADSDDPNPELSEHVEDDRGAPGTPGWDAIDSTQ